MTSETSPTPDDAAAALARARAATDAVQARSHRTATYLALIGVGWGAFTLVLGSGLPDAVRLVAMTVVWGGFLLAAATWTRRGRATPLSSSRGRSTVPYWAGSAGVYAVVVALGGSRTDGDLGFWGPAALLVALPLLVGAVRERRR